MERPAEKSGRPECTEKPGINVLACVLAFIFIADAITCTEDTH